MFLNLQQMNENFVPWGLSASALWLYTYIKSWKKCRKSDFKEIVFKLATSERCFCWHQSFIPRWFSARATGLNICIKSWQNVYKIRLQWEYFKLVANDRSDKSFLLTSKLSLLWLSAPDLRLYTFIKSWTDVYKDRGWKDLFETCNKWPTWWGLPADIKMFGPNGLCAPAQGLWTCLKAWKCA